MSKMHQGKAALLNVNLRLCLCSGRNRDSVHRHSMHRHSGHRHVNQASRTVPIVTMWKHFFKTQVETMAIKSIGLKDDYLHVFFFPVVFEFYRGRMLEQM